MRVGVFTPLLSQLPLDAVLAELKSLNIDTVELGTGNYPGDARRRPSMLEDAAVLSEFHRVIADQGAKIVALSSHGNALHPDRTRAQQDREVSCKTIVLAEKLGTPVIVDFSGCLGDSLQACAPNWVACPWPPDYLDVLDRQWNEVVEPYWTEHGKFAAEHGIKIAIEMHPGFVADSPETMFRLPSRPSECSTMPSSTSTPRTRNCTPPTCRAPACSTRSPTRRSASVAGCCAPAIRKRHELVDRVHLDAANVCLRQRAVHRARGQSALAGRRPDQSRQLPQRYRDPRPARRCLVGLND